MITYLSLILTGGYLCYNYVLISRQLSWTRASLEVSDRRGGFLTERVAWLQARLEYAQFEAVEGEATCLCDL